MGRDGWARLVVLGVLIGIPIGVWLATQFLSRSAPVSNEERWEWVDRRGVRRVIEVHRRVEYG